MHTVIAPTYHNEHMTHGLQVELEPLIRKHYEEIAHFRDIALNPDWARYLAMEAAGGLRIVTARTGIALIGYVIAIVAPNLHYRDCLVCTVDVLFIDPAWRQFGIAKKMILCLEATVRAEGVQVMSQHGKVREDVNITAFMQKLGYLPVDIMYAKRLDR
jgi:GNAT superfamily N-acetyltransferase